MNMQDIKQLIYKGEKVDVECKKADTSVPKSVYESYSGFANTKGGYIFLGVNEDKKKRNPEERFIIQGISNPTKQLEDFWNTINGTKVNVNILKDEDVFVVDENGISVIVIHVPRADYNMRPVYVGENPYKGTFKRNHEGDYHMPEYEVNAMIRDKNPDGNDSVILEGFTMEDIDLLTLQQYRQRFQVHNPEHVWNFNNDKEFLQNLGGYRRDRRAGVEGLTIAGLLMFGKGLAIRDEFDNIFMDYRDESEKTSEIRWNDRVTYDGTWENNLFNFFTKVTPKLTSDLKKPFKLENNERIDDTIVHKAIREAFVNLIIHSDYLLDSGTLKIIKLSDGYEFTNPGILKLPVDEIFKGGNSKSRNPRMQTMLRMVGFGDNAGSGFPTILNTWKKEGWVTPILYEDTRLNQVTLSLKMIPKWKEDLKLFHDWLLENESINNVLPLKEVFDAECEKLIFAEIKFENVVKSLADRYKEKTGDNIINSLKEVEKEMLSINFEQEEMIEFIEVLKQKTAETSAEKLESAETSAETAKSAKKTAETSAEKLESAEMSAETPVKSLTDRQKQVLDVMSENQEYTAQEIALLIGIKGSRTRDILKQLVQLEKIEAIGLSRKRRYIKK